MTLPRALRDRLAQVLGGELDAALAVYGGDINQSAQIRRGGDTYFVKWNAQSPPEMFPAEAHGLRTLAAPGAIRVPAVIAAGDADGPCPAFLVLEWIETGGRPSDGTMERFGAALASLHRYTGDAHGLDRDNFIGRLPQPNPRTARWAEFYRDHRIGFQMGIARRLGRLPTRRENRLTRLIDRLPDLLADDIPPSLIHGDLWGGNYLVDDRGEAVLIDPAACYGHREMDLAMSELFGGFSARFYEAYFEAFPAPGYAERRDLYQLYYILVHLNHFGESYGPRVDSLAARYVGR
jgi:fructosamine-3-kinase